MKRLYLIIWGLFLFCHVNSQIPSTISKVTVFQKGAQITRIANVQLLSGNNMIKFIDISPDIDINSIQVKGKGDFSILSVLHQFNYINEQKKRDEIIEIEKQIKVVEENIAKQKSLLDVYSKEEELVLANRSLAGKEKGVKAIDLKEAVDFLRIRLMEIKMKKIEIDKTIENLQKENTKLYNQKQELNVKMNAQTSEILVHINSNLNQNCNMQITYIVANSGWNPTYDVRVKDVENPVVLTYKANVFQNTGEDWKDVKLTISSANLSSGAIQQLNPWMLRYNTIFNNKSYVNTNVGGESVYTIKSYNQNGIVSGIVIDAEGIPVPGATIRAKDFSDIGTVSDFNGKFTLKVPHNNKGIIVTFVGMKTIEIPVTSADLIVSLKNEVLAVSDAIVTGYAVKKDKKREESKEEDEKNDADDETTLEEENNIPNFVTEKKLIHVQFEIDIPYTIPSDGKEYAVDMKNYTIPAHYEYACSPKLSLNVYLMAQITGWEEYNLLDGEANIFYENTFISKSALNVQNTKDTLVISIGRDENIVVSRKKMKDFSSKQFIGNKQRIALAYEISVRNKRKQTITITIDDQIPIPATKEIEVEDIICTDAVLNKENGILKWRFQLKPMENKVMNLKYTVKFPKDKNLNLR